MVTKYLKRHKPDEWYKKLLDKTEKNIKYFRETGTTMPAWICSTVIPETTIKSAIVLPADYFSSPYTIKMRFNEYCPSLFLPVEREPNGVCNKLNGKTLKKLLVEVFVEDEGFFFKTTTKNLSKALK